MRSHDAGAYLARGDVGGDRARSARDASRRRARDARRWWGVVSCARARALRARVGAREGAVGVSLGDRVEDIARVRARDGWVRDLAGWMRVEVMRARVCASVCVVDWGVLF